MTAPRSFDISECETPQDMARWLLRCPFDDLSRDEGFIRRWLQCTGFREGLAYIESILAVIRAERREDGQLMHFMAFSTANGRLWRVAEGLEPVGLGD
ncbi:hypothetical protein [Neorhizobium alkalisoli]|uniref:Uncharacterized protein n=1 Tax=Neorhizobium alkalisoli TaxID=528178 RepID=A0A561QSD9_9HYPH|nr:hypothetical protein [Neorhizobium alkalisoli]TWF53247.1 hypothetical protein FHW37_104524 [Neorhizobium alkalisoli]